jgi:hypothetical protein
MGYVLFALVAAMAVVVLLCLVVAFFVAFPSRNRRLPGPSGRAGDALGQAVASLPTLRDGDEFLSHSR